MKHSWIAAALLAALSAQAGLSAEGMPSQNKLANLGLSTLAVVDDDQGAQVRGKQFILIMWTLRREAGAVMGTPLGATTSVGQPLTFGPLTGVTIVQNPPPVVDPATGTNSRTGFSVQAGASAALPQPPGTFLPLPPFP